MLLEFLSANCATLCARHLTTMTLLQLLLRTMLNVCKQLGVFHSSQFMLRHDGGGSGISWTICKSLAPCCRQITTPSPHLITQFFTGCMLFLMPTNSVKALKAMAIRCWFTGLSTPASILKDVDITQQIVAICVRLQQGVKLNQQSTVKTARMCVCAYHCAYTIQHRMVLIIFSIIFIAQMLPMTTHI